jgi:hypothetical protein
LGIGDGDFRCVLSIFFLLADKSDVRRKREPEHG